MKNGILIITLMFVFAAAASAADFGLLLGAEGGYAEGISPEGFSITGTASPWFSAVVTEKINLYMLGKVTVEYAAKDDPPESFFFEMGRAEANFRPVPGVSVNLGRRRFGDSAGMIASGLFDGLGGSVSLGSCTLSLDAFYTGLLYKETAKILMTESDRTTYRKTFDDHGLEGYFASRRILLALGGEFPGLSPRTSLTLQGLAQIDVNGTLDTQHSQYLEARFTVDPLETLHLALAGIGECAEAGEEIRGSMAAFGRADWEVPGVLADMFSAEFRWTGGNNPGYGMRAFTPVTSTNAGRIFDIAPSALMSAGVSYQARPHAALSAEGGAAWFIRTDSETLRDGDLDGSSDSPFLGSEVYGSLIWAAGSSLRLNAGAGAFFPGGAFRDGAEIRWKMNLGLILSL
jgi:hypothetical protein